MGKSVSGYLEKETGVLVDFYDNFDTILLSESSVWFGGKSRTELYTESIIALATPLKNGKR